MYRAPVAEIAFTLKHVAGIADDREAGHFGELGDDLIDAILEFVERTPEEEAEVPVEAGA